MPLTVSTGGGDGYGQVLVNQEGPRSADDYRAYGRIGSFAREYNDHVWKSRGRPWAPARPNTPPTSAEWCLTTPAGDQQRIAGIVGALVAGKDDALVGWNQDKG